MSSDAGTALSVTSNGEVEGPRRSGRLATRAHTFFPRPRRHYRASRTPPTIVRRTLRDDEAKRSACNAEYCIRDS
jgi:hypothetical protein